MTDQPAPPDVRDVHAVLDWAARLEAEGQTSVSIAGLRLQLNRAVSAAPAAEPRDDDVPVPELWWEHGTGAIEPFDDMWRMAETGDPVPPPSPRAVRLVAARSVSPHETRGLAAELYNRMSREIASLPCGCTDNDSCAPHLILDEIDEAARSVSPDTAPATTETSVEYRVIGTPPTTWGGLDIDENAEISSSDPLTFEEADHRSLILKIRNGWTGVRVESRQVSTTTTTTAWKAEQA